MLEHIKSFLIGAAVGSAGFIILIALAAFAAFLTSLWPPLPFVFIVVLASWGLGSALRNFHWGGK